MFNTKSIKAGILRRSCALICAVSASVFCMPQTASAVVWDIQSDTSLNVYRYLDSNRNPIERLRFGETLSVMAMTLPHGGKGRIFARTLLRLQGDPNVGELTLVGAPADAGQHIIWRDVIRPVRFDVLSASVAGFGVANGLIDFEIGRFVRLDSLGFAMVDGGMVRFRTPVKFGVGLLAGFEPSELRDSVSWNPFRLDGFAEHRSDPTVLMYGGTLFSNDIGLHSIRVDAREWREVGADERANIRSRQVGGAIRLAFPGIVFVDADARYDLIGDVLGDLRGRVMAPITDMFDLEARYNRTVPIFDTNSIWSVFSLYPMQDMSMGARVHLAPGFLINARGSFRVVEDARAPDYEPGAHLGILWRKKRKSMLLSWDHYQGATGTWNLFWLEGGMPVIIPELTLRAGFTFVYINDTVNTNLYTNGYGGHISANYQFAPGWTLRAFVENHETRLEKHATRAVLVLSSSFGGGQ